MPCLIPEQSKSAIPMNNKLFFNKKQQSRKLIDDKLAQNFLNPNMSDSL